jgi:HD-GYP domain-containing protein (c-di-GMP phosphodiesterase class II)
MAVPLRVQNAHDRLPRPRAPSRRAKRFDEGQRKLLSIIGSRAAAAIENARLYEDLQATFQQTIEGLAKAIDKMDRYTAGHSDRVAAYAACSRSSSASREEVEIVRQSALMHDIGKIGCVLNLNKPGKLTNDEYEVFKKHPVYGRDILDPIKFLHPLIPGVYLHHERWDGRGYPLGLKGQDIPLIARIISVADTYDAMTSDRSVPPRAAARGGACRDRALRGLAVRSRSRRRLLEVHPGPPRGAAVDRQEGPDVMALP